MTIYPYWDKIPEHLKTKTQLSQMGKKPGGPVRARVEYRAHRRDKSFDLYDVNEAKDKRQLTEKQKAGVAAAQVKLKTCSGCGRLESSPGALVSRSNDEWRQPTGPTDGVALRRGERLCDGCWKLECRAAEHAFCTRAADKAIRWARRMLGLQPGTAVFFDVETTDLDGEIIEVAVTDLRGNVLFSSLVRPDIWEDKPGKEWPALYINHISRAMTDAAPSFREIWPDLAAILRGKVVFGWSVEFDASHLESAITEALTYPAHGIAAPRSPMNDSVNLVRRGPSGKQIWENRRLADLLPTEAEAEELGARCMTVTEFLGYWQEERLAWSHYREVMDTYRDARKPAEKAARAWIKTMRFRDVMPWYSAWYGDWRPYRHSGRGWYRSYHYQGYDDGDWRWQPLHGGHRAAGDCQATARRLHTLANDALSTEQESRAWLEQTEDLRRWESDGGRSG